jgi:hypothetical protein
MNDDEIELVILSACIDRYEKASLAAGGGLPTGPKSEREIDVRPLLAQVTGRDGAELALLARQWAARLASPSGKEMPLRSCSDASHPRGEREYHVRAYEDSAARPAAPAWDRVRDLQEKRHAMTQDRRPITINIDHSIVGNLNLGHVMGSLQASVTALSEGGQADLAALLRDLVERIPGASELSSHERQMALELTSTLSEELRKEPERRFGATIRAVASALGPIVTRTAELAAIWEAIKPYLP